MLIPIVNESGCGCSPERKCTGEGDVAGCCTHYYSIRTVVVDDFSDDQHIPTTIVTPAEQVGSMADVIVYNMKRCPTYQISIQSCELTIAVQCRCLGCLGGCGSFTIRMEVDRWRMFTYLYSSILFPRLTDKHTVANMQPLAGGRDKTACRDC